MPLTVNGEQVDDALIKREIAAMRPRYQELASGEDPVRSEATLREWARENMIERVLLRQEALRDPEPVPPDAIEAALRGCGTGPEAAEQRREAEAQIRLSRLIERITAKVARPRHKDLVEYYKKNKERFWGEELIHTAHIVRHVDENNSEEAAHEQIKAAERELRAGAAFAEVAERYSDCKGNGGDLGFVPRGEMVAEFEDVVFSLDIGQVSDIFRSPFGFHIATVKARKPAGILSFNQVESQIEETLFQEKKERALEAYVDRLKAKAVIAAQ